MALLAWGGDAVSDFMWPRGLLHFGAPEASTLELIFHFPTAHDASRALSLAQDHTWHFGRAAQHAKLPEPLRALLTQMEELDTAQVA